MLIMSGLCFVALIILAVIGENILPLYGGDVTLAARGSKASFALLGGWAFAFVQPALWTFFAGKLQKVIAAGGLKSAISDMVLSQNFVSHVRTATSVFCWMVGAASTVLATQLWSDVATC